MTDYPIYPIKGGPREVAKWAQRLTQILEGRTAATQADAIASTVSVDSANAGGTYTAAEQTLINELKADVNTLKGDLNAAIIVINALIDKLQTSELMSS